MTYCCYRQDLQISASLQRRAFAFEPRHGDDISPKPFQQDQGRGRQDPRETAGQEAAATW